MAQIMCIEILTTKNDTYVEAKNIKQTEKIRELRSKEKAIAHKKRIE